MSGGDETSATWVSALADGFTMDQYMVPGPSPNPTGVVLWLASAKVGTLNRGFVYYLDVFKADGPDGLDQALRADGWRMPETSAKDSPETL